MVDIVTSSYPDNILQVPVYQGSGNINVRLSEIAQTSGVCHYFDSKLISINLFEGRLIGICLING